MYNTNPHQFTFEDFEQPLGLNLTRDNQWVKRAELIPWEEFEAEYAELFPSTTGNTAAPVRLALGALLIQSYFDVSDRDLVEMIQENPYLQYFCGLPRYDSSKPPFDSSSLVHFRKRFSTEVLQDINERVIRECKKQRKKENSDDDGSGNSSSGGEEHKQGETANEGTLILDATCSPVNIRYPQDTSLLNEAREKADELIDKLVKQTEVRRPRTYRQKAAKEHQAFSLKRRHTSQEIRKHIGQQLNYLKRVLKHVERLQKLGAQLTTKDAELLAVIRELYDQQLYMYKNKCHQVENRIVSLSQPWIRPIVRGKVKNPTEFGPKIHMSISDGFARIEKSIFEAFNEGCDLTECVERYREREGHYPKRVLADKIYRTRENRKYCKEHGIRLSGPPLGRKKQDDQTQKKQMHQDGIDRIEVERRISTAKRCCGLGLIWTKLQETTDCIVGVAAILLNLRSALSSL